MVTLFLFIAQTKYSTIQLLQTYSFQNIITIFTSTCISDNRNHSKRKENITPWTVVQKDNLE